MLLVGFRRPFIDGVRLGICFIDPNGSMNRQRKRELFSPAGENSNEFQKSGLPCRSGEYFYEYFLPDSRLGTVKW